MTTELLIRLAGIATLCILTAASLMPRVIDLRSAVSRMPRFHQKLFWVYMSYTAFTIMWMGIISVTYADELATGSVLAKVLLIYFALFWGGRLIIQYGFFDMSAFPKETWHKAGYHMLAPVFLVVTAAYGWAAYVS
ncbi:MAG: hypothetical protein P8L44_09965 [Opitutales bacterium]|jgi:hypothetical protein|nr:hypothetical protein [Opitutales bacterium]